MTRSTKLFLIGRWCLIIVGILLAISGLIVGTSSHQITYQNGARGTVAHYLSGDTPGIGYLQMNGSSTLYFVNEKDFTPLINGINTFGRGNNIAFVYTTGETQAIDEQATNTSTHLVGTAYRVVQVMLFDNTGQNPQVFMDAEYTQHPQGILINNWPGGAALLIAGVLVVLLALFLPRLLRRRNSPIVATT